MPDPERQTFQANNELALQAAGCKLVPIGPHAPGEMYVQDPFGIVFDVIARSAPE